MDTNTTFCHHPRWIFVSALPCVCVIMFINQLKLLSYTLSNSYSINTDAGNEGSHKPAVNSDTRNFLSITTNYNCENYTFSSFDAQRNNRVILLYLNMMHKSFWKLIDLHHGNKFTDKWRGRFCQDLINVLPYRMVNHFKCQLYFIYHGISG